MIGKIIYWAGAILCYLILRWARKKFSYDGKWTNFDRLWALFFAFLSWAGIIIVLGVVGVMWIHEWWEKNKNKEAKW